MTDWTSDPRPLRECLVSWAGEHGVERGISKWVAERLAAPRRTVDEWLQGRRTPALEGTIRLAMTQHDHLVAGGCHM